MPYSSGGGSHSGGSHGGSGGSYSSGGSSHSGGSWSGSSHSSGSSWSSSSHSSSSWGSSSSSSSYSSDGSSYSRSRPTWTYKPHVYEPKRNFKRRKTYVYYRNNSPIYVTTYGDIENNSYPRQKRTIFIVLLFMFIALSIALIALSFKVPSKLSAPSTESSRIIDKCDYLEGEDTTELNDLLYKFKKKTGIAFIILLIKDDYWSYSYRDTLEEFAFDYYVDNLKDEKCWLLVYSNPSTVDNGFVDWKFEYMQGDYTGDILTKRLTRIVVDKTQAYLMADQHLTTLEALTKVVQAADAELFKLEVSWTQLIIFTFLGISAGILVVYQFKKLKNDFYRSELVEIKYLKKSDKPKECTCEYCGGKYVWGAHISCPNCGASIPLDNQKEFK